MDKKLELINDLFEYKFTKAELKLRELELKQIKAEYQGISSGGSSGLPSGSISKTVENEVIKKNKKEEFLIKEINRLKYKVDKIDTLLEVLTYEEQLVIEERYFNNQDFYMISDILGYGYSTVRMYHKNAIDKLLAIY